MVSKMSKSRPENVAMCIYLYLMIPVKLEPLIHGYRSSSYLLPSCIPSASEVKGYNKLKPAQMLFNPKHAFHVLFYTSFISHILIFSFYLNFV